MVMSIDLLCIPKPFFSPQVEYNRTLPKYKEIAEVMKEREMNMSDEFNLEGMYVSVVLWVSKNNFLIAIFA